MVPGGRMNFVRIALERGPKICALVTGTWKSCFLVRPLHGRVPIPLCCSSPFPRLKRRSCQCPGLYLLHGFMPSGSGGLCLAPLSGPPLLGLPSFTSHTTSYPAVVIQVLRQDAAKPPSYPAVVIQVLRQHAAKPPATFSSVPHREKSPRIDRTPPW